MKPFKYSKFSSTKIALLFAFLVHSLAINAQLAQPAVPTLCQQLGNNFVPDITISEFSIVQTSSLGAAVLFSKKILVNGTLQVNSNFSVNNCQFKMGKNAKIEILNGFTFGSFHSKYFSCGNDLWTGIVAFGNCTFRFNHVEDANLVLEIKNATSNIVFVGNLINRNVKGIYASNIVVNALVVSNTFDVTSPINASPFGGANHIGIHLNECPAAAIGRLDNIATYRNNFINQTTGIRLYNTTSTVGLSTFDKNSRGVVADYCNLRIQGSNQSLRNYYLNSSNNDIVTSHSSLTVLNSTLEKCKGNNIKSTLNNNLETINISENVINIDHVFNATALTGIILDRTQLGSGGTIRNIIKNNKITIQDYDNYQQERTGIAVSGYPATNDYMLIGSNIIEANKGGTDSRPSGFIRISVGPANNFTVSQNIINSNNTAATGRSRWAMHIHSGTETTQGNILQFNQVSGHGNTHDVGCCAFHIHNSGAWKVCSNTTDLTYRGFHFEGACDETDFGTNTIKDHSEILNSVVSNPSGGLIINGTIGRQFCTGNFWTIPEYTDENAYAARLMNSSTSFSNAMFVWDLNDANLAPPDRRPLQGWFQEPTLDECANSRNCFDQKIPEISDSENWVITSYPLPNPSPGVIEWQETKSLLAKLMTFPALVSGNAVAFKTAYDQQSAGVYARFDSLINTIPAVTANFQQMINQVDSLLKIKQLEIIALDTSLTDLENIDLYFMATRLNRLNELASYTNQRNNLINQIKSAQTNHLDQCAWFNSTLPQNQIFEKNQNYVNKLLIKYSRGLEFNQADKDTLHLIAQQCESYAGRIKWTAISLLPLEERSQYWRENSEDEPCQQQRNLLPVKMSVEDMVLFPNPAANHLIIKTQGKFSGEISIHDLTGRLVHTMSIRLPQDEVTVSTESLKNGFHTITLNDFSKQTIVSKGFIIQK